MELLANYFEDLENGIQTSINKDGGNASPRKLYSLEIAKFGKRLYSSSSTVAWCGVTAPFDLLYSLGITSCFVEFIGAMLASTGMTGNFIEASDQLGYSSDACSYHRAVIGAAKKNLMPVPKLLIGTTNPCSGGLAVIEQLARHFNKPFFVLHIPQNDSPDNVKYLAGQIKDAAQFAALHTGKTLDLDVLKKTMENSNKACEISAEIYNLAKTVPSPASSKDLSNFGIVMSLFLGSEAAISLAAAYRDEFKKRISEQKGGIANEKKRLLWIQNRIQFRQPLESIIEKDFGAVIVTDELNDINWAPIDPDNPFEGLARRAIAIPFNGTSSYRIEHLKKLAREYKVDGAINPCNWGCRQGTGARGLVESGLKEIGVPVLNLEVDCVDERKFTLGQFRTRIEAFMEMLETRPSPWQ